MGLEGAVRLGFRKELEAIDDAAERDALFRSMVARPYERGKAINMASVLEIDRSSIRPRRAAGSSAGSSPVPRRGRAKAASGRSSIRGEPPETASRSRG